MGDTTKIQWTDKSWSPVIGCTKRHTGCLNCYAERYGKRFGVAWGNRGKRRRTSDGYWKQPLRWARQAATAGKRIRVFPSLCDPLDPRIPAEVFAEWMDLIRRTARVSRHIAPGSMEIRSSGIDWLLLTKLPERWAVIPEDVRPLVWLGTSISDQATADEWVPRLLGAQGFALRFLSVEPLVGPVDLERWLRIGGSRPALDASGYETIAGTEPARPISWVIIGGESGPKARPCDVAWIRAIVKQCKDAGVAPFVKQLGALAISSDFDDKRHCGDMNLSDGFRLMFRDSHGGDQSEWPEDLRVREFPEVRHG